MKINQFHSFTFMFTNKPTYHVSMASHPYERKVKKKLIMSEQMIDDLCSMFNKDVRVSIFVSPFLASK